MKNYIQKKLFNIKFGIIKKIKILGKIIFLKLLFNDIIIDIFIKNIKIKFKKSIIGIYYYNNFKENYILEICFYKLNINNNIKKKLIKFKSFFFFFIRNFFFFLNFKEIDTPIIERFENTGSKQFLIINKKKNFLSLSQSPQKFKQYYIFNNIEKYFQIVKCFRNEDERSYRLKEFLQLDIEMNYTSFNSLKNIINIFLLKIYNYLIKKNVFFLKIKFKFIKKFFFEKKNFNKPYIYKKIKILNFFVYIYKSFLFLNIFKKKIFFLFYKKYFIIITKNLITNTLCYFFEFLLTLFNIINFNIIIIWYINFNYFNKKKINHHQFSSYKNNFLKLFNSKSLSYDLYINGIEIGGGSIRNIDFKIQKKNFFFLKEKKSNFLNFYKKNIPQHCGIALGIERVISLLCNYEIRNIISYLKFNKINFSKNENFF